MQSIQELVAANARANVSQLVATLANGTPFGKGPLNDLVEKARQLASPIPDYEEAAREAGWEISPVNGKWWHPKEDDGSSYLNNRNGPRYLCEDHDIEPCDREVYEHWIVSDWLADKLIEKGEKVDKDFADIPLWARTSRDRPVYEDDVIRAIHGDVGATATESSCPSMPSAYEIAARAEGWLPDLSGPRAGAVFKRDHGELHEAASWEEACGMEGIAVEAASQSHEYLFDVKLFAAIRVMAASEAEARKMLKEHVSCSDANLGAWPNGDPILAVASADDTDHDELIEIDGEAV